jgi:pSer/pThr/pTyr-binding forkhead associated (FHA) protein
MSDKSNSQAMQAAKIVWKNDQNDVQEFILNQGNVAYIGRDKDNNILLANPNVSKHHANIQWKEGNFVITDQGSSNGTYVNGSLIKNPTPIKDNDRIEIGDYVISFYILGKQMYETLMTRPLTEMEGTKELPLEELRTQKLVEEIEEAVVPEKISSKPMEKIEEKPLPVQPAKAAEKQEMKPEVQAPPIAMPVPEVLKEEVKAPEKKADNLEEVLADLLQKIQAAQAMSASQNEKGLSLKQSLETSIGQLQLVADEMEILESDINNAGLAELLNRLTKNPNDVKLLMDLANKSALMAKLLKNYISQGVMIGKIKEKLNTALKNYIS